MFKLFQVWGWQGLRGHLNSVDLTTLRCFSQLRRMRLVHGKHAFQVWQHDPILHFPQKLWMLCSCSHKILLTSRRFGWTVSSSTRMQKKNTSYTYRSLLVVRKICALSISAFWPMTWKYHLRQYFPSLYDPTAAVDGVDRGLLSLSNYVNTLNAVCFYFH